jgi:hypothetical protein
MGVTLGKNYPLGVASAWQLMIGSSNPKNFSIQRGDCMVLRYLGSRNPVVPGINQLNQAEIMMFGLNKKSKLETRYRKLLEESYRLSQSNRQKSDEKLAAAEEIRKQIDAIENSSQT